jgi:hypothetical protein
MLDRYALQPALALAARPAWLNISKPRRLQRTCMAEATPEADATEDEEDEEEGASRVKIAWRWTI